MELFVVVALVWGGYKALDKGWEVAGDRRRAARKNTPRRPPAKPGSLGKSFGRGMGRGWHQAAETARGFGAGVKEGWPEGKKAAYDWRDKRNQSRAETERDRELARLNAAIEKGLDEAETADPETLSPRVRDELEARRSRRASRDTPTDVSGPWARAVHPDDNPNWFWGDPDHPTDRTPGSRFGWDAVLDDLRLYVVNDDGRKSCCGTDGDPDKHAPSCRFTGQHHQELTDDLNAGTHHFQNPTEKDDTMTRPTADQPTTGTSQSGEVEGYPQLIAALQLIGQAAVDEYDDAEAAHQRAMGDARMVETMTARLSALKLDPGTIASIAQLGETAEAQREAAKARLTAAEQAQTVAASALETVERNYRALYEAAQNAPAVPEREFVAAG